MDSLSARILAAIIGIVLIGNTAGVAFLLAERLSQPSVQSSTTSAPIPQTPAVATASADWASLQAEVADLRQRLEAKVVTESQSTPKPKAIVATGARENTIFMGSGSTANRDWTTIDSAAVTVDTAQYGSITEVRFEAALSIISGEVYARLAEKGTSAVYYESQLTHNRSTSEWKTSVPLTMLSGKHTYVVQLRSSNGERANLDGARLKILSR